MKMLGVVTTVMGLIKTCCREIKYFFQHYGRGFKDSELVDLDITIAEFILPRLKRFRQVRNSRPDDLTDEEWDEQLGLMIEAFEFIESDAYFQTDNRAARGLQSFAKYMGHLWL